MKLARVVFWAAGVWGVLVLVPLYFLMGEVGRQDPPGVTHPEFYFGFVGVALVWQVAFFVIGSDPVRYRPLMVVGVMEKFVHVAGVTVLFWMGMVSGRGYWVNMPDLVWGVLFLVAWVRVRARSVTV